MNGECLVILFVIVCCYGAGLIIYDKEKKNDTWFINETIYVRYDSLYLVFIFIKVNESNND